MPIMPVSMMAPPELYQRARLSWLELLDLAVKLFVIVPPTLVVNLVRAVPQCLARGLPVLPYAYCNLLRTLVDSLTPRQLQGILPPTGTIYRLWLAATLSRAVLAHDDDDDDDDRGEAGGRPRAPAPALALRPDMQPLSDGKGSILWLGDRATAARFVLFLHGGGYVLPLDAGHLNLCRNAFLSAAGGVAVAVLQYSLCPGSAFPTQLRQAAEALRLVLGAASAGAPPADVVLGGDSCGGHMAAGLLAHLAHPLPGVPAVELGGARLAGVFLVSPWLSAAARGPSFRENARLDMVSARTVRRSAGFMTGGGGGGGVVGWAMPGDVEDGSWWDGVDGAVGELLVTVGEHEVLRDEIVAFAERIRARNPRMNVVLDMRPQEAHDFILLEGQLNKVGGATAQLRAWYRDILQRRS